MKISPFSGYLPKESNSQVVFNPDLTFHNLSALTARSCFLAILLYFTIVNHHGNPNQTAWVWSNSFYPLMSAWSNKPSQISGKTMKSFSPWKKTTTTFIPPWQGSLHWVSKNLGPKTINKTRQNLLLVGYIHSCLCWYSDSQATNVLRTLFWWATCKNPTRLKGPWARYTVWVLPNWNSG